MSHPDEIVTYQDLKYEIDKLTPEQLGKEVIVYDILFDKHYKLSRKYPVEIANCEHTALDKGQPFINVLF